MGFLDEALESYTPPAADDLNIVLPARVVREPAVREEIPQPVEAAALDQAIEAGDMIEVDDLGDPGELAQRDAEAQRDEATTQRDQVIVQTAQRERATEREQEKGATDAAVAELDAKQDRFEAEAARAGGPAGPGAHGGSGAANASGSNPEPVPQRDEPDDGEHTDSTEDDVTVRARAAHEATAAQAAQAARSQRDALLAEAQQKAAADADRELNDIVNDANAHDDAATILATATARSAAASLAKPVQGVHETLVGIRGSDPRMYEKTGFSAGGTEMLTVKRFPQVLIDRLRLTLAPVVGGEFAEALSAPALISAFLIAKTGVELDVDANTAVAVDVFRQVDPRLLAVEEKIDEVIIGVAQLANAMNLGLERIGQTGKIVEGVELSQAYLIADRVSGLTTSDVDETNVDVTQKKVLAARHNIRMKTRAQRVIDQQREGRRMA